MHDFDNKLKEFIAISLYKKGGITRNLSEYLWNTPEIQKKVYWGIYYFKKLKNTFKSVPLEEEDIKNELYITFSNCLLKFDYSSNTIFTSYFNIAVKNRIERLISENKTNTIDINNFKIDQKDINYENILFEYGLSKEEIISILYKEDIQTLENIKKLINDTI